MVVTNECPSKALTLSFHIRLLLELQAFLNAMSGQKRITKVCYRSIHFLTVLTLPQEFAELQKNPIEGMQISLLSESDIYKWQILIAGPKDSPYAVRSGIPALKLLQHILGYIDRLTLVISGRPFHTTPYPSGRLPIQTSYAQLPDQDLPP